MKSIWCAELQSSKAFDDAMAGKGVKPASCDVNLLLIIMRWACKLGVSGTPALIY